MRMLKTSILISLATLGLLGGCTQAQSIEAAIVTPTSTTKGVAAKGVQAEVAPTAKPMCSGNDFLSFLKAFASDDEARDRYTESSVLVTDWRDPNETEEGTAVIAVEKSDYRGFTLRYRDNGFHDVGPDGVVDPEPSKVDIAKRGEDYEVSYAYNISEGNSWIFKSRDGCWYLAEDPEPSDP
jgi:hypothetical protein